MSLHEHIPPVREKFEEFMRWRSEREVGLTLEMDWVASTFIFSTCKVKSRVRVGILYFRRNEVFLSSLKIWIWR
jgi:hypothetical protein